MAIDIQELRPDDVAEASAFLQTHARVAGESGDVADGSLQGRICAALSVVSKQENQIVGLAACLQVADVYRHVVAVADGQPDADLARRLLDKALFKFIATGTRLSHIRLSGDAASFWTSVQWGRDLRDEAPGKPASVAA